MDFRIVGGDRVGDVLQGGGLAGLRRGDDQATLALADRRHDVDEAAGELVRRGLLLQAFLRIQRGELAELRTMLRFLDAHAVDGVDGLQRHELLTLVATFAFTRGADRAVHGVALAQAVLLDLAHGDIHVVRSGQVAGRTHERVGVEHVDDAGDRHEVFLRLVAMRLSRSVRSIRSLRWSRSALRSMRSARSLRSSRSSRSPLPRRSSRSS